jgi:hypothetical protein
MNRLCGPVVRVPGYRSRGPGLIPRATRFSGLIPRATRFTEKVVGLERGPLSLVSTIEELLERKISDLGVENPYYGRKGSAALTTRHPSIRKSWH